MRSDPLLCAPDDKARLEAENTVVQLDYLTSLVQSGAREVREMHIRELQHLAVDRLYPCGGRYRDARFTLKISDGSHRVPEPALLPGLLAEFIEACNDRRYPANLRMAYALWRFNWIHPFAGGNGRTARALSYVILCMDLGRMPPGVPSIPALIAEDRDGYIDALRAVDANVAGLKGDGAATPLIFEVLHPMVEFLDSKLEAQLMSGLPRSARWIVRVAMRLMGWWFRPKRP